MPGIKRLRKIQLGKETVSGTPVAATTILRAEASGIEDTRGLEFIDENVGIIVPTNRAVTTYTEGKLEISDMPATFEQLRYIFHGGIASITPTNDGTGSGKVWTYVYPVSAIPNIATFTFEAGDNQKVERMAGAFCESFTISGAPKEYLKASSTWIGTDVSGMSAFTSGLSVPTVEDIPFASCVFTVEDPSETYGGTTLPNTLVGFSLEIKTGLIPVYAADYTLNRSFIGYEKFEGTLKATFIHNASAVAEKEKWRSKSPRFIRIQARGSDLSQAGSYSKKNLSLDCWGVWEKFDKIGDLDGNDIIEATLRLSYDSVTGKIFTATIVIDEATLP